ncbi:hypothetical protein [Clostridium sp.]|uniref:hypothetical protein n=1 Tax=Clostridium sp. TaxID=1506 RepID=UPI003F35499E
MIRSYCSIHDAYFTKDRWLELKCCSEPNFNCRNKCFERPDIPCVNCKVEKNCPDYKEEW